MSGVSFFLINICMTRNKFEAALAKQEPFKSLPYEPFKLKYTDERNYLPDWIDVDNKIIYEAKGRLTYLDRRKMLLVKAQYPDWTIVFIFQSPNTRISKGSKTTYKQWAEKHGFVVQPFS